VTLQQAGEQLKRERDAVELDLRANVGTMSQTLASRILGVDVAPATATTSATKTSGR
jgi:F-type H+-transporting ATPase subunit b